MGTTHGGGSHADEGFTLVELLVAVIIIGILVAITIPQYLSMRTTAWTVELTSAVTNVAIGIEAAAAVSGNGYLGADAAFADEAAFDAFVLGALAALEGPAVDPVTYQPDDGTATATDFTVCMHHNMLEAAGTPTVSVTFDSDAGGLQDPVSAPC